jgi:hypothetical protein
MAKTFQSPTQEQVAPTVNISGRTEAPPAAEPATRVPVKQLIEDLDASKRRVADLEASLLAARTALADLGAKTPGRMTFPEYPICDDINASRVIGNTFTFRFAEGLLGGVRRRRLFSLFLGLHQNDARLADGQHVDLHAHAIFWLLDQIKLAKDEPYVHRPTEMRLG